MNPQQKEIVELHKTVILEFLYQHAATLLPYMERQNVIDSETSSTLETAKVSDHDLVDKTFKKIKVAATGWRGLIGFLVQYGGGHIATLLEGKFIETSAEPSVLALSEFTSAVAQYYLGQYGFIPSHLEQGGNRQHVKEFWVPLQMEYGNGGAQVHHLGMQNRLITDPSHVAVVMGEPGTGKTTLVKKICYDWAIQQGKPEDQYHQYSPFSLVLAVPLRSVGTFDSYVQLAIDFFVDSILCNFASKKLALTQLATTLGSKLLIILDGLDEYASSNFAKCPLAKLFAPPLASRPSPCNIPPKQLSCKVMITSRPYALEQINQDFHPIRGQMCPLDKDNLDHFVNNYCKSAKGKEKVKKYLEDNLVIKTPLILSFICFLADSDWQINLPSSLTIIYDTLIWHMIVREKKGVVRLKESIEYKTWKTSKLAKSTSKLAFLGCSNHGDNDKIPMQLEFDRETIKKCEVTEDSFNCGFLLDKLNVVEDCHKADFPHRSIQEFFAALHCYRLILRDSIEERNTIVKVILNQKDSQVGRFLFGLFCTEKKFDQMSDWLQISFADIQLCKERGLTSLINQIGRSLADCSKEDQLATGRRLLNSIGQIGVQIVTGWNLDWTADVISRVPPEFFAGLYSKKLGGMLNFALIDIKHSQLARLVGIAFDPPKHDWLKEFQRIEIFTASSINFNWIDILSQPRLLPRINIVHLLSGLYPSNFNVTVQIERETTDESELRTLRLQYITEEKLEYLTKLDQFKTTLFCVKEVQVDERQKRHYGDVHFFQLTVSVNRSVSQSTLICSLIKLALEIDYTDTSRVEVISAVQVVSDLIRNLKDLMASKHFQRDITLPVTYDESDAVQSEETKISILVKSIRQSLPQLRSSQFTSEVKEDLVGMLLSCVERTNRLIHEAHLYLHSTPQPSLDNMEHEGELLRARVHQNNLCAQMLAEMQIYADASSPYLKEVRRILSHLSRPDRSIEEFDESGYVDDSIVMLLNQIVIKSADKSIFGEMGAVEIICDLIAQWLAERPFEQSTRDEDLPLERLKEANLKVKSNKCQLGRDQIPFLGYIVSPNGPSPYDHLEKLEVIWSAPDAPDVDLPLEHCWMCLNNICLESDQNQLRFVMWKWSEKSSDTSTIDGMDLFDRCRQNGGLKHIRLVEIMMRLMANKNWESIALFWEIWCLNLFESSQAETFEDKSEFQRFLISFRCAKILANLTDSSQIIWPLDNRIIDGVEIVPFRNITEWRLDSETFVTYSSFGDNLANLHDKSPQHQLVTVWTIANCTVTNADKYCPTLRDEGAVEVLREIIILHKTDETEIMTEIKRLAALTIDNIGKFVNNTSTSMNSSSPMEC